MNGASQELQKALNEIRDTIVGDNKLYHQQIPLVDELTSSQAYGQALLSLPSDLRNRFIGALVNKISYTAFEIKYFQNPLIDLQRDEMPLGAIGEEIYINPARGRVYNCDDFAGLLAKYSADVKVEYTELNFDVQYPVTIIRDELEKAFNSWGAFEEYLAGITTSLYNGAYIDDYDFTRKLITNAYSRNAVQMETFTFAGDIPTESELKSLVKKLRKDYKNFQIPSTKYNAWKKVGGYGRSVKTWANPDEIVVFLNNELASDIDVEVLASAFHINETSLMGKIYYVEDFNIYDEDGNVAIDGSNIIAFICDRRWFKIRSKKMFMDDFYNASNRSWNSFLNVIKGFNYSIFTDGKMYVKALPTLNVSSMKFVDSNVEVNVGANKTLLLNTEPFTATQTITFTLGAGESTYASIEKIDNRNVKVTGLVATTGESDVPSKVTITATAGNVTTSVDVVVKATA